MIVVDEADYLLKDEHQSSTDRIKQSLMRDVQQIYTSATMPANILEKLTSQEASLKLITIEDKPSSEQVQHLYIKVNNRDKVNELKRLKQVKGMRAIVFFEQIHQIEEVAAKLIFENVPVVVLHSEASKMEREYAMRAFTNHDVSFLLTTDVASRGMDIQNVPYVIHYNSVDNIQTYLHRSGRTGRMKAKGTIISLVNQQEHRDFEQMLQKENIHLVEKVLKHAQLLDPQSESRQPSTKNQAKKSKNNNKARKSFQRKKEISNNILIFTFI
ncbi:helicase-related protein [Aerococcaceae bacterium WGS1372]